MRIERFSSTHFRNLAQGPVDFSRQVNVLVGPNGHGKTNILEALQFFELGRSFRAPRDTDLICFGESFCRVELRTVAASGERNEYAVGIERSGAKRIKVDGKEIVRYSEMIGRYPCVMFGPQDLALSSGEPAERRRFLDVLGSVTDPEYLEALRRYRRVLAQRNEALKSRPSPELLDTWTAELVTAGCALVGRRVALADGIRELLAPLQRSVGAPISVDICYESELLSGRPEDVGCVDQFSAALAALETEERRRGVTLSGPHRDDMKLIGNGRDVRRYGSQGERRLFAVLLRLAELSHIERKLREPCVLLLDDVFSELDEALVESFKRWLDGGRQVFVTSPVRLPWGGDAGMFRVVDGRISRQDERWIDI